MEKELHTDIISLTENSSFVKWVNEGSREEGVSQFLSETINRDMIQEAADLVQTLKFESFDYPLYKSESLLKKINASVGQQNIKNIGSKPTKSRMLYWSGLAVAASLALLVFVNIPGGQVELNTDFAESLNYQLPDGSNLAMNAATELKFDKKKFQSSREISMDGEAFFEVEKGESFVVKTEFGTVEVLGTSFNVYARDGKFEVGCNTGKVKVSNKTNTSFVILTPGQECILKDNKITKVDRSYNDNDWIRGIHHFQQAPLVDVISELERQFNVSVQIEASVDVQNYTGYFETTDLNNAFESVLWPLQLQYEKLSDNSFIVKNDESNN